MEIKKHRININIINDKARADTGSNFVLDLKNQSDKLGGLSDNEADIIAKLAAENEPPVKSIKNDWLKISNRRESKLAIKEYKLRQLMLWPLFKFIYQASGKVYNFTSSQLMKLAKIARHSKAWTKWLNKVSSGFNNLQKVSKKRVSQLAPSSDYKKLWEKKEKRLSRQEEVDMIKSQRPPFKFRRWFYFALILFLLIIPFKVLSYYHLINFSNIQEKILGNSQTAISNLMSASESAAELKLGVASSNFWAASNSFWKAQEEMKNVDELIIGLAAISKNEKYRLASEGKEILNAGAIGSKLGSDLALAFNSLINQNSTEKLGAKIAKFVSFGKEAISDARDLNQSLQKINPDAIPVEYREQFASLKIKAQTVEKGLAEFISLAEELNNFLGVSQDKRYLLVFQNNNELRASGGFIGSYALVDLRAGQIKNLEVPAGGSYDTEAGLRVLVAAPKALQLVNPLWHFWDANWWPDWRLSARNLMWFYEKSSGPTVDGVISFTPTVLEKLLSITGPIDMTKDYGVVVDANNFWEVTQSIIEKTGNPELYSTSSPMGQKLITQVKDNEILASQAEKDKPKKIIGDLMNRILAELPAKLTKENISKLLQIVDESLSEKQILLYFNDSNLQAKMENNSWAGEIKTTAGDYLAVINTNIAGGKSDRKIVEKIDHKIAVQADNSIIDTVTITRQHTGQKNEPFSGVRNVDWLRVYVPRGSQLLEANGFSRPDEKYFEDPDSSWQQNELVAATEGRAKTDENSQTLIYNESNKTVFANWAMVDPGQSISITLKYKLPFKLNPRLVGVSFIQKLSQYLNPQAPDLYSYSLLVQKQPGALPDEFSSRLQLAQTADIFWKYPTKSVIIDDSGWSVIDELKSDRYYTILFKNK